MQTLLYDIDRCRNQSLLLGPSIISQRLQNHWSGWAAFPVKSSAIAVHLLFGTKTAIDNMLSIRCDYSPIKLYLLKQGEDRLWPADHSLVYPGVGNSGEDDNDDTEAVS